MFSLTHQERKVLIFIGILILSGSLLRLLNLNAIREVSPGGQDKIISAQSVIPDELVNVNTASAEGLKRISGIGEVLALRIITYRTQFGFFKNLEDLKKVNGIGDKKIETIKRYTTFQ